MIRLTLNAQSHPEIHLFNKPAILFGSDSSRTDLILSGANIQPIHLKIENQNGAFLAINQARDPFASINGQPFGKKVLFTGDVISIGDTTWVFESLPSSALPSDAPFSDFSSVQPSETPTAAAIGEDALARQEKNTAPAAPSDDAQIIDLQPFSLAFEGEVEALSEEELQKIPIDLYLSEQESQQAGSTVNSLQLKPEKLKAEGRKSASSLKDDYLKEWDDDDQSNGLSPFWQSKEPSHLYQAWKWILFFIFSLLSITGAAGTIIYFTVSGKTEAHETKVAQGMADVTMALTYAQLNHLKPHNQNWSDVDFLKSNLQLILPDSSSFASQIDAQGQFNCCPYSLRIYTSRDLSRFLLIAQPAPNLLNWLIPRSLIVVDSQLMELRLLKDARSLNRLLANSDPLEGLNGKEITSLIKKGALVRLSSLASDLKNSDFSLPKNIAWINPGTENLIYNAPRYYRIGQNICQHAVALSTSKATSGEVTALKQNIEAFSQLQHFILYSDKGKSTAQLVRQGVMMCSPSHKLSFGYLLFNAQGKIHQVRMLKDEETSKESLPNQVEGEIAFLPKLESAVKEGPSDGKTEESFIDKDHPIYIQLQALVKARENELKPLADGLSDLIESEMQIPSPSFQTQFQKLSHLFLTANAKHKKAKIETLETLFQQYSHVPIDQFLAFLKVLNLDQLIKNESQKISPVQEDCRHNMELLFAQIRESKSLEELDALIVSAGNWLNFDAIKNPEDLLSYQNLLRNSVLVQMENYLLSDKNSLILKLGDKAVLERILNHERLIKPDEKEFFLNEFEEVIQHSINNS